MDEAEKGIIGALATAEKNELLILSNKGVQERVLIERHHDLNSGSPTGFIAETVTRDSDPELFLLGRMSLLLAETREPREDSLLLEIENRASYWDWYNQLPNLYEFTDSARNYHADKPWLVPGLKFTNSDTGQQAFGSANVLKLVGKGLVKPHGIFRHNKTSSHLEAERIIVLPLSEYLKGLAKQIGVDPDNFLEIGERSGNFPETLNELEFKDVVIAADWWCSDGATEQKIFDPEDVDWRHMQAKVSTSFHLTLRSSAYKEFKLLSTGSLDHLLTDTVTRAGMGDLRVAYSRVKRGLGGVVHEIWQIPRDGLPERISVGSSPRVAMEMAWRAIAASRPNSL